MAHSQAGLSPEQQHMLDEALDYARSSLGVLEALRQGGEAVYAAARLRTVEHGLLEAAHRVALLLDTQILEEQDEGHDRGSDHAGQPRCHP